MKVCSNYFIVEKANAKASSITVCVDSECVCVCVCATVQSSIQTEGLLAFKANILLARSPSHSLCPSHPKYLFIRPPLYDGGDY